MASVGRDPFARGEYDRQSAGSGTCHNCGQKRRVVFTYVWTNDDSNRRPNHNGQKAFCNIGCHHDYHG